MAHTWMSHTLHVIESCRTYDWVMSHIWMSHVTQESPHLMPVLRSFLVSLRDLCILLDQEEKASGAACGSVLRCVAVCCSALQCVAVCCSTLSVCRYVTCVSCWTKRKRRQLQRITMCCSVLQCDTVRWSVLHCVAVCCRVLQCLSAHFLVSLCDMCILIDQEEKQSGVASCGALHCVAVCCSALHCVAECCSALQCVAACLSAVSACRHVTCVSCWTESKRRQVW